MDSVDRKIVSAIQGRYIGYIAEKDPPSLVDMCYEFHLEDDQIDWMQKKCVTEGWEQIRLNNHRYYQEALIHHTNEETGDIVANFKIAARGALAQRFSKLNIFNSLLDAQLQVRLENGLLGINHLLRFKELMLKEADSITKAAIEIAKLASVTDPEGQQSNNPTKEKSDQAMNKWRAGGEVIASTGRTLGDGNASEDEKGSLFDRLKQMKPKGESPGEETQ